MDYDYDHSSSDEDDIDDLNLINLLYRRRCPQPSTQRRTANCDETGEALSTVDIGVEVTNVTIPSNEETTETTEGCRRHRPRVYKNRSDHFLEWDDIDFYHRFRLSKRVINCVLDLIKGDIKSPTDW